MGDVVRRWAEPVPEPEARVLTGACVAATAVLLFCLAVPFSPTAPLRLTGALVIVSAVLAICLFASRRRLPVAVVHGVVGLAVTLVSVCVATSTTAVGAAVTAFGFVWLAMYAAWFHPGAAVRVHTATIGVGLLTGLQASDAPALWQTWFFVMASVGGVALTLDVLVRRLRRAADHDQLTGLPNRAAFLAAAERVMLPAQRRKGAVTVAVIDLDDFKAVNDRDGHAAGDRQLADLARSWDAGIRRTDLLARYGGDEFVLLMPDTTAARARELLDRLAGANTDSRWSAGVAQWGGEPLEGWIAAADRDLYRRKASPRGERPGRPLVG
jgi:diguanylate cyclase (GGDEF)-like protein